MNITQLAQGVNYVGVDDRTTPRFDNMWPLPTGMSYNSYLVQGTHATALIDGVGPDEIEHLLAHIRAVDPDAKIDYLIVNHMEPDHSGAIPLLLREFPGLKIVASKVAVGMIQGFFGIDPSLCTVATDGMTIDLGGKTLVFYMTPFVHWPETMMTYLPEERILFSCDGFGSFRALNGYITDEHADVEPYIDEIYRYYSNIVAKYGKFVKSALAKLNGLEIGTIAPSHGLVWRKNISRVVDLYARLADFEAERGAVVVYGSMYGHTRQMAEYIAAGIAQRQYGPVKIHNAIFDNLSYIYADIMRYDTLVVGSATYCMELFPPVQTLLNGLKCREFRNRRVAAFGSYAWAPNVVVPRIKAWAEEMNLPYLGDALMKQGDMAACRPALDSLVDSL